MEAAEEMLLAEGKSAGEVLEQTKHSFQPGESQRRDRELAQLVPSLEARSGKRTVVLDNINPLAPDSLDCLKSALDKHGPCVLCDAGHARILDRIERTPNGYVLDVRDPFTGSALRVNMHAQFTRPPRLEDHLHRWDAVFLSTAQT